MILKRIHDLCCPGFNNALNMETEERKMHKDQEREQKITTGVPRCLKLDEKGSNSILKYLDRTYCQENTE